MDCQGPTTARLTAPNSTHARRPCSVLQQTSHWYGCSKDCRLDGLFSIDPQHAHCLARGRNAFLRSCHSPPSVHLVDIDVTHVIFYPRPPPTVFAYCKRSNTGGGNEAMLEL